MIQVRRSVFETNSSSSHSIIVMNSGQLESKQEILDRMWIYNGKLDIRDNEFGRSPFRILYNAEDKITYVFAYYANDEEKSREIEDIVKRNLPEVTSFDFPEEYSYIQKKYFENRGYVDHQSYGLLDRLLSMKNITLEEFIFNSKYAVVIDGDEYNIFLDMLSKGLINESNIEDIVEAF